MSAGKPKRVRTTQQALQKGDVIGVCLDLDVPQISFTVNGVRVKGFFRDFNVDGMFFPVVSLSAKVRLVSFYFVEFYKYVPIHWRRMLLSKRTVFVVSVKYVGIYATL